MEKTQDQESLINSFDKLASTYCEETDTFSHKLMEYIDKENLLMELPLPNNKIKLLDLGGGIGKYSAYFSELGYKTTLVDISNESLKIAKENFLQEKLEIEIINASGEDLPLNDNSFDIIVMIGTVISYSPNPKKLLKECYRVLKHGGIIFFDFLNNNCFRSYLNDAELRLSILEEDEKLTQMGPEDYPVRSFNRKYMENIVNTEKFKIKSKYGKLNVTTSLPLDFRWSKNYNHELLERYKKIELNLSRDPECYGTSLYCCIIAIK